MKLKRYKVGKIQSCKDTKLERYIARKISSWKDIKLERYKAMKDMKLDVYKPGKIKLERYKD